MTQANNVCRYYLLPLTGALTYLLLEVPVIQEILKDWIPDPIYRVFVRAVIILLILFIVGRVIDIYIDPCTVDTG